MVTAAFALTQALWPDAPVATCRYPDETRYPCCGYHCQTCNGNDAEDPYYCPNSPVRCCSLFVPDFSV